MLDPRSRKWSVRTFWGFGGKAQIGPHVAKDAWRVGCGDVVWVSGRFIGAVEERADDKTYCPMKTPRSCQRVVCNELVQPTWAVSQEFTNVVFGCSVVPVERELLFEVRITLK